MVSSKNPFHMSAVVWSLYYMYVHFTVLHVTNCILTKICCGHHFFLSQGSCYLPSSHHSRIWSYKYHESVTLINNNYYSFKIFPRFWLVKTTRIIHHNQLLFTKFGKNLRHIESMTSKVESSENYWIIDVKMTSKVQPVQIIEPLTAKTSGQGCVIFGERIN